MNECSVLFEQIANGIIKASRVAHNVEEVEKSIILALHGNDKVWQGKNGSWYTYLYQDGERRLIKKNTRSKLEEAIIDFYIDDTTAVSVESVFNLWIERKVEYNEICLGTKDRYINDFNRFFKPIKGIAIKNITEEDLEDFIRDSIKNFKLTAKSFSNLRTLIIGTWKYAKKLKLTNISISMFMKDLEISKKVFAKAKKKPQVFMDDEIPRIVEYITTHKTIGRLGILLTFQTGMREAELSALKYSDIGNNILHVHAQEIKHKSSEKGKAVHEFVEYTKTESGTRDIILTPKARQTIEWLRELNPHGEYLMEHNWGAHIYTNSYNRIIYDICDELGIPRRSMHKIRKTYGTTLLDAGVDDSIVSNQMGHSSVSTTRRYYYFSNKSKKKQVEQIQKAIPF